jgi:phytoene synthase
MDQGEHGLASARRHRQRSGMTTGLSPDRRIAIGHAPPRLRPALETLFALDDRLAGIVRATREPMIGQMRLTWWHDALTRLDNDAAPAEPLLRDLQGRVLPGGITGQALAGMIDGWEELIVAEMLDAAALERYAALRGGRLFALAGRLLGGESTVLAAAGEGWALNDLAANISTPDTARLAQNLADALFAQAFSEAWPRTLRPVGVLSLIARLDRTNTSPLGKAMKVYRFQLTGR